MKISNLLKDAVHSLSKKRPIFHSEADFQHSLAWEIKEILPHTKVRLERRFFSKETGDLYIDITVEYGNTLTGIEVKYATRRLRVIHNGEEYWLKDQAALDIKRYDFLKDIYRLEKLIDARKINEGVAIFLTNIPALWNPPKRKLTNDMMFRIHDGRRINSGEAYKWKPGTSKGTMKGREKVLKFSRNYVFKWEKYSLLAGQEFKVLVVRVK